jgi:hypothetical protein
MLDLAKQAADAEERLTRLYGAIEAGTVDGTDPTLRERVAALKGARDKSIEALDYAKKSGPVPIEIDPVIIERFTRLMREKLVAGDAAGRKAYLSAIIDSIVVSEHTIRITGSNDNLRSTLGPNGQPTPLVRKSVQEWCPGAGCRSIATIIAISITYNYPRFRLCTNLMSRSLHRAPYDREESTCYLDDGRFGQPLEIPALM